jgi:type II secretory pathway pseudopilin PulG
LFEAVMVLVIVGTIVGALMPSVLRQISRARVNRAANVVAADCLMAQSLASRLRSPVTLVLDNAGARLVIYNTRTPSESLLVRPLGTDSEFKLQSLTASPASAVIFPNGMTTGLIMITVGAAGYTKSVRMTRAGQVRIL